MVEAAHSVGLRTTSTIMFGHIDGASAWAAHLAALRRLACRTSGISEFVPLPFVHMQAPIYLKGALPPSRSLSSIADPHNSYHAAKLYVHTWLPHQERCCCSCGLAASRGRSYRPANNSELQRVMATCDGAGRSRRGPTLRECVLMHSVARLALHPHITNIQVCRGILS